MHRPEKSAHFDEAPIANLSRETGEASTSVRPIRHLKPSDLTSRQPTLPGHFPFFGHALSILLQPRAHVQRFKRVDHDFVWVQSQPGRWTLMVMSPDHYGLLKVGSNRHYTEYAPALLGRSIVTLDGVRHRRQRKAMNTPFSAHGISASGTGALMKETIEDHVQKLGVRTQLTALTETRSIALNVILRILQVPCVDLELWRTHYETMLWSVFPIQSRIPGMPAWWAARSRGWLEERVQHLIDRSRRCPQTTGLIAEMVRGWMDQGPGQASDGSLIENILLLILAGHETTASTMAWMTCHLARSPELWARACEEVALSDGVPASPKALRQFPLIEGLFRECIRLYPPVTALSRLLMAPTCVNDVTLPAGIELGFPIWLWNRDPRRFSHPERFDPDRWVGQAHKPTSLDNIGFSFGPHFCMGYHIAWMEAVQYTVALVQMLSSKKKRLELTGSFPWCNHALPLAAPRKSQTRVRVVDA